MKRAQVTRILFDGKRAMGVEYRQDGTTKTARAAREVILSGGAVNSPQLLQLSGIGDPSHLSPLGIETVVPSYHVGRNLKDHLGLNYTYKLNVPTLNDMLRPWWGKLLVGHAIHSLPHRAAVDQHQPGRRLLQIEPGAHAPEHAALLSGLLDADPQGA